MHAKILVVEDETMSRTAVGDLLADLGHSPELCASAEQGLAQFDRTIFDIVISDITLPGLDGLEMVRRWSPSS
jgi:DNA-binding response OmpR family regulator